VELALATLGGVRVCDVSVAQLAKNKLKNSELRQYTVERNMRVVLKIQKIGVQF
jgi:hypothetical protein